MLALDGAQIWRQEHARCAKACVFSTQYTTMYYMIYNARISIDGDDIV